MRYAVVFMVLWMGPAWSAEPTVAQRARAALALADEGCGLCRSDLPAARQEAMATGQPIVLFVGGCDGRAAELPPGTIPVRADSYTSDGRLASEPRVVILRPKADGMYIVATLAADTTAADLRSSVERVLPAVVTWRLGRE